MLQASSTNPTNQNAIFKSILVVIVAGIMGVDIFLIASNAATPYSSAYASAGQLTGVALVEQASTASNGESVLFGKVATTSSTNPLAGDKFYVVADNFAEQAASADPSEASELDKIATQSTAIWLTNTNSNNQTVANQDETSAVSENEVPVFVLYAIPDRDCDSYSGGGYATDAEYESFVNQVKAGIAGRQAVVIIEPDSLTDTSCLSSTALADRISLLKYASDTLTVSGTSVYLDAGNATEQGTLAASQAYMLPLLVKADITKDAGFELDTSLDEYTSIEQSFGDQMTAALTAEGITGKGYTIDTSRNGNGPAKNALSAWCNLPGLGLGSDPTSNTSDPLNEAYLWVKYPGQSDGSCEGAGVSDPSAPASGVFWPAYAIGLAEGDSP